MNVKLLFGLLFLVSLTTFAQDKKWSVEANYGLWFTDESEGDDNIVEAGLKYRFADLEFVSLGASANVGFSGDNFNDVPNVEGKARNIYVQPRVFAEFNIPGIQKLKPSIALGYSFVNEDIDVISIGDEIKSNTTDGGFNLNLGLSYDITKRFFVQAQYDFINLNVAGNEFMFQNQVITPSDDTISLSTFRFGLGFRF